MTTYHKYSDEDLIEAYTSMLDYSGNVSDDLLLEIELRGGIDSFKKKIEDKHRYETEIERLSHEVYSFCRQNISLAEIKSEIKSDIVQELALSDLIESKFQLYYKNIKEKAITTKTLLLCIVGGLLASIAGSIIWGYSVRYFEGSFIFLSIYPVINFLVVKLVVRKSERNLLVFLTAFISVIISYFGGFYVFAFL